MEIITTKSSGPAEEAASLTGVRKKKKKNERLRPDADYKPPYWFVGTLDPNLARDPLWIIACKIYSERRGPILTSGSIPPVGTAQHADYLFHMRLIARLCDSLLGNSDITMDRSECYFYAHGDDGIVRPRE